MILEFDKVDCDECETHWFLGKPGICDVANNTCICPPGYSGRDDWFEYKTCHVNEDLARLIHKIALGIAVAGLVTSFFCTVFLCFRWRFFSLRVSSRYGTKLRSKPSFDHSLSNKLSDVTNLAHPPVQSLTSTHDYVDQSQVIEDGVEGSILNMPTKDRIDSDDEVNINDNPWCCCELSTTNDRMHFTKPPTKSHNTTMRQFESNKRDWRRKRDSIYVCALCLLFTIVCVIYQAYYVITKGKSIRSDGNVPVNVSLALSFPFIMASLNILLVSWFYTLPDLTKHGFLLQLSPFLNNHPNFVFQLATGLITFVVLFSIIVVIVIPYINRDLQVLMDYLYVVFNIIYIAAFLVMQVFLVRVVTKLFKMTLATLEKPEYQLNRTESSLRVDDNLNDTLNSAEHEKRAVKMALRTTKIVNFFALNLGISGGGILFIQLVFRLRFEYLLFNFSGSVAYLVCIITPLVIASRTSGGLMPNYEASRSGRTFSHAKTGGKSGSKIEAEHDETVLTESYVASGVSHLSLKEIQAKNRQKMQDAQKTNITSVDLHKFMEKKRSLKSSEADGQAQGNKNEEEMSETEDLRSTTISI